MSLLTINTSLLDSDPARPETPGTTGLGIGYPTNLLWPGGPVQARQILVGPLTGVNRLYAQPCRYRKGCGGCSSAVEAARTHARFAQATGGGRESGEAFVHQLIDHYIQPQSSIVRARTARRR